MRAESFISPYWSRWRSYFGAECAEGQRRRVLWSWREIRRALWMSPSGLNQGPVEKRLNANMSEVVLPPSRIFVQPQEYTEALVVFFFIPLCDIKHPWCSRYCQTVVQRQVTGNSSFYWFLRTTMQQLYFSLKQMMQTRNTRMNQCDAEDIGCRVWKRLCLLWDLQQRCSSEADEQAAVNTAGLLPFLNWAPDLPRKPSCALLRERKMTKQAPAHVSFPANSCRVLHRVLLNEWHQ